MICAGAGDGTTSVLKLDESLINNSKLDRNNASDMFERLDIGTKSGIWTLDIDWLVRETRRERILDNRTKALLVAEKQRHNLAKVKKMIC